MKAKLILIFALLVTITPLLAYAAEYLMDFNGNTYLVGFKGKTYIAEVISVLPDDADHSKLLRVLDPEMGVVCYILQNDTADFYSGLQCIKVGSHNEIFRREK